MTVRYAIEKTRSGIVAAIRLGCVLIAAAFAIGFGFMAAVVDCLSEEL